MPFKLGMEDINLGNECICVTTAHANRSNDYEPVKIVSTSSYFLKCLILLYIEFLVEFSLKIDEYY